MDKRYYKKKGPSYKERLRCPLCGKLSDIGFFSQDHQFGIYRFCFAGYKKISCKLIKKTPEFMKILQDGLIDRFLELLQAFAGCRYYSQNEVDKMMATQRFIPSIRPEQKPVMIKADVKPVVKTIVKPYKIVIE